MQGYISDFEHIAFIPKAMIYVFEIGRSSGLPNFLMPSRPKFSDSGKVFQKAQLGLQLRVQLPISDK